MSDVDTAESDWIVKKLATRRSAAPDSPPDCDPGGSGIASVDHVGMHALATDDGDPVTRALTVGAGPPELEHAARPAAGSTSALTHSSDRARRESGGAKDPRVIRVSIRIE